MGLVRLLAAVLLTALIAVPATAAAATAPRTQSPVALATSIAARYWGAVPCQGHVQVLSRQRRPAALEPDSDAWVTFSSSLGANDLAAPAATYGSCTVDLGRLRWPTTGSMKQDWDMLCMTVTHEYGHLLGHPHDATPGSVMAPVFTDYSSEPRLCRTGRPSGWGR